MANYNLYFKISDDEIHTVRPDGLTGLEWFTENATPLINITHKLINGIKYEFFNCIVNQTFIDELPNLLSFYPSAVVIGVWRKDGLQYGWKYDITIDSNTQIETKTKVRDTYKDNSGKIVNKPSYPYSKTDYLELMPDINTFDIDGNLTSSVRPTISKTFHSWSGWTDKDFS